MRAGPCLATAALILSACAAVSQRGGQRIAISTNPSAASCRVDKAGAHLADIAATPAYIVIGGSAADLLVTCSKPGYQTVVFVQQPHLLRPRTGNVVVSRTIGAIIDGVSGGIYEYPGEIALDLSPRTAGGNASPY